MKKLFYVLSIFLIMLCAVTFTACGENYEKFSLHFSSESIELSLGESEKYEITVENYSKENLSFNFDFDRNIAEVKKIEDCRDGRFLITVNSLMTGSTTLRITLLEGKKILDIPVNVYEPVQSFTLKDDVNLYVLRGNNLTLSSDMFSFSPSSTIQKDLIFALGETELVDGILATNDESPSEILVNVTSKSNTDLSSTITVKVLDEIKVDDLSNTYLRSNTYDKIISLYDKDKNPDAEIVVIANDEGDKYINQLEFVYNPEYSYKYTISSLYNNVYLKKYTDKSFENSIFVDLQYAGNSRDLTDFLIVSVMYDNFDDYKVDLIYKVEIKMIPKSVKLNGLKTELEFNLFDKSDDDDAEEVVVSIDPAKSTNYSMKVNVDFVGSEQVSLDFSNYVMIKYNGKQITNNQELSNLTLPLKFYGIKVLPDNVDYIVVSFICTSDLLNEPIQNQVKIKINKRATDFYVSDEYEKSTIYVKNGEEVLFDGFVVVDNDAYIGKITAIPKYLSAGYVEISQVNENEKTIKIKALKVGQATYTFVLSSGISTELTIIVKEELDMDQFMVYVSSNTNQGIAQVLYKKANDFGSVDTIKSISIRGKDVEFDVSYLILPKTVDIDMYSVNLQSANDKIVKISNNKTLKTVSISEIPCQITVDITLKRIENFKLKEVDVATSYGTKYNYNFEVVCFKPISSFDLTGANGSSEKSTNQIDVYDRSTVGYVDTRMSYVYLNLNVNGEDWISKDQLSKITWSFSVEDELMYNKDYDHDEKSDEDKELTREEYEDKYSYYHLTSSGGSVVYGDFYFNQLMFNCDGQINQSKSFKITAKYSEYGKVWSSTIEIRINPYIPVENLWISNYQSKIYLDSVRNETILYPYIYPTNATNKNFIVQYEPIEGSSSCINLSYNASMISIRYSGENGGKGILHIIPSSRFISENEYNYSLDIPVEVGIGTKDFPLYLTTVEDFKSIDTSKYYKIINEIDFKFEEITPFDTLTGGIEGENGVIVKNFVISKYKQQLVDGTTYNLFGLFSTVEGYIKNISFYGKIDVNLESLTSMAICSMGVVCGINKGDLINVESNTISANATINGSTDNYVGVVCGINKGNIKNINTIDDENKIKPNTTLISYTSKELPFKLTIQNGEGKYYFGGVCGYNSGIISSDFDATTNNRYNQYGTNVVVYLDTALYLNSSVDSVTPYIGGVCGYNSDGTIENLLVCGNINRYSGKEWPYHPNNVGGICGYVNGGKILSNTTRVFVSGGNNIGGIAGFVENGTTIIKKNIVEATDDGIRTGIEASLIVGYGITNISKDINTNISLPSYESSECRTYIDREFVDSTKPISEMNLGYYYGDIVRVSTQDMTMKYEGECFPVADIGVKTLKNYFNLCGKYPNETLILMYYQAVESSKQILLNDLNCQKLPTDLFGDTGFEFTIESSVPSVISVDILGNLMLNKTGFTTLTIKSVFNSLDILELKVHVINYVSEVEIYSSADRKGKALTKDDVMEISNRNSKMFYTKYTSIYKPLMIDLVENNFVKLEFDYNGDYFDVINSGDTFVIQGNGTENSKLESIVYNIYLDLGDGDIRYLTKQNDSYYQFLPKDVCYENIYENNLSMIYKQGIYKISSNKTNLTVEPIDDINLEILYETFDDTDELKLEVYYVDENYYIEADKLDLYFDIILENKTTIGEENILRYSITMNKNRIKIGDYKFIFSGADNSIFKVVYIKYINQTINNVIVNNYTEIENKDIDDPEKGLVVYETDDSGNVSIFYKTSYTLKESNSIAAGEVNILRVNIDPEFADYSYIEVLNTEDNVKNNKTVLFSALKPCVDKKDLAEISINSYYVLDGIRVYKDAIDNGSLLVLYRMSNNVMEGENVSLLINIYGNDGQLVYPTIRKDLVVTISNNLSVSIKDRKSSNNYVARGKSYILDVKSIGYEANEIKIESNSPYLNVEKDIDGTYILKVAKNVTYGSGEGAKASISFYGERKVNGALVKSSQGYMEVIIVEYVVNSFDINEMFSDNLLVLNVKNTVDDIRQLMVDKLDVEYASDAINAVKQLKNNLILSAQYFYKLSNGGEEYINLDKLNEPVKDEYVNIGATAKNGKFSPYTITPLKISEGEFNFGLYAKLVYNGGYLSVFTSDEETDVPDSPSEVNIMAFDTIVNQKTSKDAPLPIYSYNDLTSKLTENGSYILMNDIIIPSSFKPIDKKLTMFDGNNHKIIFKGSYEYVDTDNFGLFSKIYDGMLVCNLTVSIQNGTAIFKFTNLSLSSQFKFGLLTSVNEGTITNCASTIESSTSSINVINLASNICTSTSVVTPFVAQNDGYITNSRVQTRISCQGSNLCGFVGINNKHIASSYVKQSMINSADSSSVDANNSTAGFVLTNNSLIMTSYVEGAYNTTGRNRMYAENNNYIIKAKSIAGAFVYNNTKDGKIKDCYANIPIVSSSKNSGFVYINDGTIDTCYTTSKLKDKDTASYPFFINNNNKITNCYFLSDSNFNININPSNNNLQDDELRATSLLEFATGYVCDGLKVINQKLFTTFTQNSNGDISCGVWFTPKGSNSFTFTFGKELPADVYNNKVVYSSFADCDDFSYASTTQSFMTNRLHLVSPNLIAVSETEISDMIYNEETGEIIYSYITKSLGTRYNPIIITSASELESEIITDSLQTNVTTSYYRIVNDIDYEKDVVTISNLYKKTIAGYIEGNGLTIQGFSLNTNESMFTSGFFAQIGDGTHTAVVQNLNIAPKYINLPNAYNVGTLAGTVYRANIYNVDVNGYLYDQRNGQVIMGRDIVGGVFGRTINDFDIINISSSISVNAYLVCGDNDWTSKSTQEKILYNELNGNISTVAYSGAIIGYVGGYGTVKNASLTKPVSAIGMVSGFMFGGIGADATVENVKYNPTYSAKSFIRAGAYGGLIVGDIRGTLKNVIVYAGDSDTAQYTFVNYPRIPIAIGGVAGIGRNCKLENCKVFENIMPQVKTNIVGGIVGKVIQNVSLDKCEFIGDISSNIVAGGIIGQVDIDNDSLFEIAISSCIVGKNDKLSNITVEKPASLESESNIYSGGIIGLVYCENFSDNGQDKQDYNITLKDVKVFANIVADSKVYGDSSDAEFPANGNYRVWISAGIGGYYSDDLTALKYWPNLITVEMLEHDVKLLFKTKNYNYGAESGKYVSRGFDVYVSKLFFYDTDSQDSFNVQIKSVIDSGEETPVSISGSYKMINSAN